MHDEQDMQAGNINGKNLWVFIGIAAIIIYIIMNASTIGQTDNSVEDNSQDTTTNSNDAPLETSEEWYQAQIAVQEAEEGRPLTNTCDSNNYGIIDYAGTSKQGKDCSDTIWFQRDDECVANPPLNYDGHIDLSTGESTPELTCCVSDGTCQW